MAHTDTIRSESDLFELTLRDRLRPDLAVAYDMSGLVKLQFSLVLGNTVLTILNIELEHSRSDALGLGLVPNEYLFGIPNIYFLSRTKEPVCGSI